MKNPLKKFERRIRYHFNNPELLERALTHSSFAYETQQENPRDNEVMEFLGDSVLGLIVAEYLYSCFPDRTEGDLSKLKAMVASTSALTEFARAISLDKQIFLGKGEEKSGGRKKKNILAGAFEALIASVYLDGGFENARGFLQPLLDSMLKKIDLKKFLINNYKSALQEYFQKENLHAPVYRTVTAQGPDHNKVFTVEVFAENRSLAKAKGGSKKDAEQKAAERALKNLMGKKIKSLTSDTFLMKKKK